MNINANKNWTRLEEVKMQQMIAEGLNCKEIAERLGRSDKGVQQKMYKKRRRLKQLGRHEEARKLSVSATGGRPKARKQQQNGTDMFKEKVPKLPLPKPVQHDHSEQLGEIFNALVVIGIGVWATAAGIFLAILP